MAEEAPPDIDIPPPRVEEVIEPDRAEVAVNVEVANSEQYLPVCTGFTFASPLYTRNVKSTVIYDDNVGMNEWRSLQFYDYEDGPNQAIPPWVWDVTQNPPGDWTDSEAVRLATAPVPMYPLFDVSHPFSLSVTDFGGVLLHTIDGAHASRRLPHSDFTTGQEQVYLNGLFGRAGQPLAFSMATYFPGLGVDRPRQNVFLTRHEREHFLWCCRFTSGYSQTKAREAALIHQWYATINNSHILPRLSARELAERKVTPWAINTPVPRFDWYRRVYARLGWAGDFVTRVAARMAPFLDNDFFMTQSELIEEDKKHGLRTTQPAYAQSIAQHVSDSAARVFWSTILGFMVAGLNARIRIIPDRDSAKNATAFLLLRTLMSPDLIEIGGNMNPEAIRELNYRPGRGGVDVRALLAQLQLPYQTQADFGAFQPAVNNLIGAALPGWNYVRGQFPQLDRLTRILSAVRRMNTVAPGHAYLKYLADHFTAESVFSMVKTLQEVGRVIGCDIMLQPPVDVAPLALGNPDHVVISLPCDTIISGFVCLRRRPIFEEGDRFDFLVTDRVGQMRRNWEPMSGIPFEQAYQDIQLMNEVFAATIRILQPYPNDHRHMRVRRVAVVRGLQATFNVDFARFLPLVRLVNAMAIAPGGEIIDNILGGMIQGQAAPALPANIPQLCGYAGSFHVIRGNQVTVVRLPGFINTYYLGAPAVGANIAIADVTFRDGDSIKRRLYDAAANPLIVNETVRVKTQRFMDERNPGSVEWLASLIPHLTTELAPGGIKRSGAVNIVKIPFVPLTVIHTSQAQAALEAALRQALELEVICVPINPVAVRPQRYVQDISPVEIFTDYTGFA